MKELRNLYLRQNKINTIFHISLCENLKTLDLHNNQIENFNDKEFDYLSFMPKLTKFIFTRNPFCLNFFDQANKVEQIVKNNLKVKISTNNLKRH